MNSSGMQGVGAATRDPLVLAQLSGKVQTFRRHHHHGFWSHLRSRTRGLPLAYLDEAPVWKLPTFHPRGARLSHLARRWEP